MEGCATDCGSATKPQSLWQADKRAPTLHSRRSAPLSALQHQSYYDQKTPRASSAFRSTPIGPTAGTLTGTKFLASSLSLSICNIGRRRRHAGRCSTKRRAAL
uniref:Uncharacterized protein n=1 Tax=Plectus sambesii TaxID=2011161 RepID=A0A914V668_9BILA